MRILFVAPKSHLTKSIEQVFIKRGDQVLYLNERINYLVPSFWQENYFVWKWTIRKFGKLKLLNKKIFNKRIIKIVNDFKPNILFTTKGTTISVETAKYLRNNKVKTVNWWFENMYNDAYKKWVFAHYTNFDYFFVFDKKGASDLKTEDTTQVKYMPMAIESKLYEIKEITEQDKQKFECDVVFVGALYPEREELLIKARQKGWKIKVFGWEEWKKSQLKDVYGGSLDTSEMAKAFKLAKISINTNLRPLSGYVNFKTFEIPASGGFQLTDNQDVLNDILIIGEEVVVFDTIDDAMEKIEYYIKHEDQRQIIIENGKKRVLRDHTIEQRIEEILSNIT